MVTNRDDVGIAIRSAFLKKETQQKFSLFVLVIISIIFLFVDRFESKPLNIARSTIKDIIYRASTIVSLPGKGFNYFLNKTQSHFNVHDENIELKKENMRLKNSLQNKDFLLVENKSLKKLLNQEMTSDSVLKNAKVIVDKNSPFIKSIILNKGRKEMIKKGMAVLDQNNFIGRIVEVNFFSSRALLVTDLNSKIPVIVEPNGYQAILSGTGKGKPVLDYLPKNHKIELNNSVYTSGKDGIFSAGIPIGKITFEDEKISVSLFSDISQLSYVNVDLGTSIMEDD